MLRRNELAKKIYDRKTKHITSYILRHIYSYLYITSYIFRKKHYVLFLLLSVNVAINIEKYLKKKDQLKILSLITNIEEHQKVYNHD